MTVAELRKVLETLPDNTEVRVGFTDSQQGEGESKVITYKVTMPNPSANYAMYRNGILVLL